MKMKKLALCIVFLAMTAAFSLPAEKKLKFDHFSIRHGLSQGEVYCITRDSRGFMWFGTENGLNRFDGNKFTVFRNDPTDPDSLSNDFVYTIGEDQRHNLWIGTADGELNKFDPVSETFTHYKINSPGPGSSNNNRIKSIYIDSSGVMWTGIWGAGLHRFDPVKEMFIPYKTDENQTGLSSRFIYTICEGAPGILWIGTDNGLNRLDTRGKQSTHYKNKPGDPGSLSSSDVVSLHNDYTGILWVGTRDGGLNRFNPREETFTRYQADEKKPDSLCHNYVHSIFRDRRGMLWIATSDGLSLFEPGKEIFYSCKSDKNDPTSLSQNYIISIYEDQTGVIWVGTNGGGIHKHSPPKSVFTRYEVEADNPNSLNSNHVFAIREDRSGIIWIGTEGGGLNRYDPGKSEFSHYRHQADDPGSPGSDKLYSICEDRDGTLWIGTGEGLDRLVPGTGRFIHYREGPVPLGLSSKEVFSIYRDQRGVLWLGTGGGGLNQFDPKTNRFTHYQNRKDDPGSLGSNIVYCIIEDSRGVLWIGTDGGGLNRFNRETGGFTRYQKQKNNPGSLSHNTVTSIYEDRKGVLWIGTYGGLNKLDPVSRPGSFTCFTPKHGLPNDVICGILGETPENDETGTCLWLSTNLGLSRFNTVTGRFTNFDMEDGLPGNEFNVGAYHRTGKGEFFFGGMHGLISFFPGDITKDVPVPPVVITGIQVPDTVQRFRERMLSKKQRIMPGEVKLSYRDIIFSIEFAVLDYVNLEKNQYEYKMEGFNDQWIFLGNRHYVTFTNLDPGDYVFRVRGANSGGAWNETGASMKLTITPPLWKTWWFRVLSVILIIGMVLLLIRRRLGHVRMKTEVLAAREAQMSILPQADPQTDPFDISGVCVPAYEVGGDFFEYFWLDKNNTRFGIAVGDVSGKAMKAAMMAIMTSGMVSSMAGKSASGKDILTHINRLLVAKTDKKTFIALGVVSLDTRSNQLTVSNAGLNKPLLKRDQSVELIESAGPKFPLGVLKGTLYEEKSLELRPGDIVLLFSDGIPDMQDPDGEFYGLNSLKNLLAEMETDTLSADEIKQRIIEDVERFSQGEPQNDDITVVVVKLRDR
jgi:ligand-binding sensor domain-containing protein